MNCNVRLWSEHLSSNLCSYCLVMMSRESDGFPWELRFALVKLFIRIES